MANVYEIKVTNLPKTHFPVDPPWFLVRDGLKLPVVGQPILFVKDLRGSQSEWLYTLNGKTTIKPIVKFGWVDDVAWDEGTQEWYITDRNQQQWGSLASIIGNADHVKYWMPLPQPPIDNYVLVELSCD